MEDEAHNFEEKDLGEANLTDKIRENPWILSTFVLGVLGLILIVGTFGGVTGGAITGGMISENQAGSALINFANSQGADAELVGVEDVGEFYEVTLLINGQETPVLVTKDGENIAQLIPLKRVQQNSNSEQTAMEIPKSDRPNVELYVMSFCPYGNLGEDTMLPVYNLLKDKLNWEVHYIVSVNGDAVSSLHGQKEVDQNIRELCVKKNYGMGVFWNFMTNVNNQCGSDGTCWQNVASSLSLDVNKINSCVTKEGLNLMKEEAQASNDAGVSGSPTLIINGVKSNVVYNYGDSESYKEAICGAFNSVPDLCSTQLSSTQSTASGSC